MLIFGGCDLEGTSEFSELATSWSHPSLPCNSKQPKILPRKYAGPSPPWKYRWGWQPCDFAPGASNDTDAGGDGGGEVQVVARSRSKGPPTSLESPPLPRVHHRGGLGIRAARATRRVTTVVTSFGGQEMESSKVVPASCACLDSVRSAGGRSV